MATIYHNPRCSKSRGALEMLRHRGVEHDVIEYLKTPPSVEVLDELCATLGCSPLDITRTKEARFRELGLSRSDDRSRREWLEILAANPILIERPIVVHEGRAVIGRPPERVLDLI